ARHRDRCQGGEAHAGGPPRPGSDAGRVPVAARGGLRRALRAAPVRARVGAAPPRRAAARDSAAAVGLARGGGCVERGAGRHGAAPARLRRPPRRGALAVKLSWQPYRLRLRAPLATAHGELREREGFLVQVDEGRGEACPLPAFGTEDLAACAGALVRAAEMLAPLPPPSRIEDIALDLHDAPAARHGVELALLDLLARRRGIPLARLLDPRAVAQVPAGSLLSARDPRAPA